MCPFKRAACIILYRIPTNNRPLEVFLVQRNPSLTFMGGFHVFPGGTVDPLDGLAPPHDNHPEADRFCAAFRELFEETGILIADGASSLSPSRLDELRRHLLDHPEAWQSILVENDLTLSAEKFTSLGHWRTPPFSPLRFDALYVAAQLPPHQDPTIIHGELIDGFWLSPEEALNGHRNGQYFISYPVLETLKALVDAKACLHRASQKLNERGADAYPYAGGEMLQGIHILPLPSKVPSPLTHTNTYILGELDAVIVDPGTDSPEGLSALVEYMKMLENKGTQFKEIWLTHHFEDHITGALEISRRFNLPILAHPSTIEELRERLPFGDSLEDGGRRSLKLHNGSSALWRFIHTPGITDGHLVFYEETRGSLVAGNLLLTAGSSSHGESPHNPQALRESLEKVLQLEMGIIFPGHGASSAAGTTLIEKELKRLCDD